VKAANGANHGFEQNAMGRRRQDAQPEVAVSALKAAKWKIGYHDFPSRCRTGEHPSL
jgi:hypothetical protein